MSIDARLADIGRSLGRVEGKLDGIEAGVAANRAEMSALQDRVDTVARRVGTLERSRAYLAGISAAGAAACSVFGSYLFGFFRGDRP